MVAGVDFGMLHLKLRGQKGQEEHRVNNVMLKQQLQAPGLIFTAENGGFENSVQLSCLRNALEIMHHVPMVREFGHAGRR